MTIRRFLIWLGERLIEWQLAILWLLTVKLLLPSDPYIYDSFRTFAARLRETLSNNLADAAFMTQNFMNGDWGLYWWQSWRAAGWIIGLYIYLQGLYLFISLLARQIAPHRPIRGAVLAFLISFAVLCGLHVQNHDVANLRLALILFFGGLVIVSLSAAFGKLFDESPAPIARTRAPLPRGPVFDEDLPADMKNELAAVASQPSVLRRERLYFSD